ncbi:hypothetical protein BX616_004209 [Lobosporangium transversale]|nr:hypothetical protein BX616_004209 [Lobosporangium transversale]
MQENGQDTVPPWQQQQQQQQQQQAFMGKYTDTFLIVEMNSFSLSIFKVTAAFTLLQFILFYGTWFLFPELSKLGLGLADVEAATVFSTWTPKFYAWVQKLSNLPPGLELRSGFEPLLLARGQEYDRRSLRPCRQYPAVVYLIACLFVSTIGTKSRQG